MCMIGSDDCLYIQYSNTVYNICIINPYPVEVGIVPNKIELFGTIPNRPKGVLEGL